MHDARKKNIKISFFNFSFFDILSQILKLICIILLTFSINIWLSKNSDNS